MNKLLWMDAKIDKPKTIDPVLVCTKNGYTLVAQYNGKEWLDRIENDRFGNVEKWAEYNLPTGWKINDFYYEGVDE